MRHVFPGRAAVKSLPWDARSEDDDGGYRRGRPAEKKAGPRDRTGPVTAVDRGTRRPHCAAERRGGPPAGRHGKEAHIALDGRPVLQAVKTTTPRRLGRGG